MYAEKKWTEKKGASTSELLFLILMAYSHYFQDQANHHNLPNRDTQFHLSITVFLNQWEAKFSLHAEINHLYVLICAPWQFLLNFKVINNFQTQVVLVF